MYSFMHSLKAVKSDWVNTHKLTLLSASTAVILAVTPTSDNSLPFCLPLIFGYVSNYTTMPDSGKIAIPVGKINLEQIIDLV